MYEWRFYLIKSGILKSWDEVSVTIWMQGLPPSEIYKMAQKSAINGHLYIDLILKLPLKVGTYHCFEDGYPVWWNLLVLWFSRRTWLAWDQNWALNQWRWLQQMDTPLLKSQRQNSQLQPEEPNIVEMQATHYEQLHYFQRVHHGERC